VEYVLGPALEEMHFSWERYWREVGIALPRPIGLSRFDQTADVTQMAAVALALLLARPLTGDEYPHKIADVLDSATARQIDGSDPLPAALRTWLRRALHIEPRAAFASAIEAQTELDRILDVQDTAGRLSLRSFLSRYAAAVALERQMASQPQPQPKPEPVAMPVEAPKAPVAIDTTVAPVSVVPVPVPPIVEAPVPEPEFVAIAPEPEPRVFAAPVALAHDDEDDVPVPSLFGASTSVTEEAEAESEADAAPVPFMPPPPPLTASVTPFTPRASAFAAVTAEKAAVDVRMPVPESGPWANPGREPLPSATAKEPDMPRIDQPVYEPEAVQPPVRESVRDKAGRPAWQSPWAAAAVLMLIAVTTGVTFLGGGKSAAPAATPASTGTLEIGTNPAGVAVIIDGANRGNTPLTVNLAAGAHVVELVSETDRRQVPVTMKAGTHMSHFIEMPKAAAGGVGDLMVRTNPSKATVTVDGKPYGQSPVTVKGLTAGKHRVTLENESGSFTDDVVIEAGVTASLVVPMSRPSAGANVSGWIAINAPADLQVFEGGRLIGSSRTDRIMVAVGRHELEMVNEVLGYRSTRTVDVGAGQVAIVRPSWPNGTLAVNALPWAEVSINGDRVGETPIGSVSVPIGTHDIVFRHPELGERRTTATVTTGAATRVSMDMRAK
jgi:hypothetical protein